MSAENGELGVSHRTDASVSQPGNNAQPEIVHPAEAGSSSSQPGEKLVFPLLLACAASVSVCFRSKRDRGRGVSVLIALGIKREPKHESHFSPFFLFLVLCS